MKNHIINLALLNISLLRDALGVYDWQRGEHDF